MNGRETFCGQTKSISISKTLPINEIAGYGQLKIHSYMHQYHFTQQRQLTVWGGLMLSFIVGPLSLEEMGPADSITCTVNGKRYEGLLRNKVISTLQLQSCLDRNAFMQERVSPHIAKSLMQLLKRNFKKNKIINRHFSTIWSLRSPDLSL